MGRGHVTPDDIKKVTKPVLRHRILLKPGAEIEGYSSEEVIDSILDQLEVPR
jgi:MoxR-like ATPase